MGEVNNRNREWAGITGTIRQDLDVYLANLRLQIRDEMEKKNDAMVTTMTGQLADMLKIMQRDLIAANQQMMPGASGVELDDNTTIQRRQSVVRRFN